MQALDNLTGKVRKSSVERQMSPHKRIICLLLLLMALGIQPTFLCIQQLVFGSVLLLVVVCFCPGI